MDARDPAAIVLQCRRCGADIPSENIELGASLAKCRACNAVFGLASHPSGHEATSSPMDIPAPSGIELSVHGDELRLVRRWPRPHLLSLLFYLCCNGFLGGAFWLLVTADPPEHLLGILVLGAVVVGSLGVTYRVMARAVNRTHITVGPGYLRVRQRPLPWPGNRDIDMREIEQLYCEKNVARARNTIAVSYSLNAVPKSRRKLKLLTGLEEPAHAVYLEQVIESHLGIVNRPVRGELRR